jgi:hypothetical protein
MNKQKDPTALRLIRFRASELRAAARQATQLGCALSDVIRAGLRRTIVSPVSPQEVAESRLPEGRAARQ